MPELNLTEERIRKLKPPSEKKYERYWDSATPGLCVKVTRSGEKRFLFKYRTKGSRKALWYTGPRAHEISLAEMRIKAAKWNIALVDGGNPFARSDEIEVTRTVADLCRENLERKKALGHSQSHLKNLELHQKRLEDSKIGNAPLETVTPADAVTFLKVFSPRCADQMRSFLSNSYELGIKRAYIPLGCNPWRYTDKRWEPPKPDELPRFTDEEMKVFTSYLRTAERGELGRIVNPVWLKFMWFLVRTGTRPSDAKKIERSWLRIISGVSYILHPCTKTGEKRIVLPDETVKDIEELNGIRDSIFLFPGRTDDIHMQCYKKEYNYMRKATGLTKPAYAIRRWFAHAGRAAYGGDVEPIQKLVGWETEAMALRYSGNDESFMEKFILENAEISRTVNTKIEEVSRGN